MPGFKGQSQASDTVNSRLGSGTPAMVYCALFTVAPTAAGGGTECAGGTYARVAITNNRINWPASSAGAPIVNALDIDFGTQSTTIGIVVAAAIVDTPSGALGVGDVRYAGLLTNPRSVNAGEPFKFLAGGASFKEL